MAGPGAEHLDIGEGDSTIGVTMSVNTTTAPTRRWWQRLFGSASDRPYGLPESWVVVGAGNRTEVAVGPGGVFLLDHRRLRPEELARNAGDLSGRLTAALGQCVTVQGVLVEEAVRPVRADQPNGVTIVTSIIMGPWLKSHPTTFDERQVRTLARAVAGALVTVRTD